MAPVKQVQWDFFRNYAQGNFDIAAGKLVTMVQIMFPESTLDSVAKSLAAWLRECNNMQGEMKASKEFTFHNGLTVYFIDSKYHWVTGLGELRRSYSLTVSSEHSALYREKGFTRWFVDSAVIHLFRVVPGQLTTEGMQYRRVSAHVPWDQGKLSSRHHPHIVLNKWKKVAIVAAVFMIPAVIWGGYFYLLSILCLTLILRWTYLVYRYNNP